MKIRVAICQVDMEWENTARNLKRLEPIVAAADADVVVLPEMFATGFKLRPACVAEPADGLVVTTMRRWAAQYGRASRPRAFPENGPKPLRRALRHTATRRPKTRSRPGLLRENGRNITATGRSLWIRRTV